MDVLHERCCGIDIGQAEVVACVLIGPAGHRVRKEIRKFRTFVVALEELRDWLLEQGCTHVVMESTGVYWMPVYTVLEGHFELVVGNARHIKNVPGRKTDVKDAEWLAQLLRHGLIAPSFVPPKDIRELRDLTRFRRKLVEAQTSERNRTLKLLEKANIKLASVASNVFGTSGMLMLRALAEGKSSAAEMAQLAQGRLRVKQQLLVLALSGRVEAHHRMLLATQLRRLEAHAEDLRSLDERIEVKIAPYKRYRDRLIQIPGIDRVVANALIAELGVDMTVFKSARHCAAWAGLAPGNNESAGKHGPTTSRKGNIHLKTLLIEAAIAAGRVKKSYFSVKFQRLRARRGYKRAAMAIAHKLLIVAFNMLAKESDYQDLGLTYLDSLDKSRHVRQMVIRLERMGYVVKLEEKRTA